jgi:hypothetical protein
MPETVVCVGAVVRRADRILLAEPMEPWSDWLFRRVFAGDVTVIPHQQASPLQPHGAFL